MITYDLFLNQKTTSGTRTGISPSSAASKYPVAFSSNLVCGIPSSFERSSLSNIRTQGSFIHINSGKIFERNLVSSDSVANLGFSETELCENARAYVGCQLRTPLVDVRCR